MTRIADIAYAAGLFDGEGTVRVRKALSIEIAVSGNHMPMHTWLQSIFGGSVSSGGRVHYAGEVMSDGRVVQTDSVQEWKWRLNGQRAIDFLELVEPFLIEKRHQSELITANRWLWPEKPIKVTDEVRENRTMIRNDLIAIRKDNGGMDAQ